MYNLTSSLFDPFFFIYSTTTATGTSTVEALKSSAQRYEAEKLEHARQKEKLVSNV